MARQLSQHDDVAARLTLHVVPNAKQNGVVGWHGDALKVKVMAPPEGGRANRAVCETLAQVLGVPVKSVQLEAGAKSRRKTVTLHGLSTAALAARLPPQNEHREA